MLKVHHLRFAVSVFVCAVNSLVCAEVSEILRREMKG